MDGKSLRTLIDTNIVINRENNSVLPKDMQELMRLLSKLKIEVLVHPKSVEELSKDPIRERKEISVSKVAAYSSLESPPDFSGDLDFLSIVDDKIGRHHDHIDNIILYAVYKNAVNFLFTEDKEIHRKAVKLGIKNRVLTCAEALELLKTTIPNERLEHPPALKLEPVYNLNLKDSFFDSLKKDYDDFENWFKKISAEGRYCYVHTDSNNRILALLILKDETEPIPSIPPLGCRRRLKLCTFKGEKPGNRIGELFIKLAVKYCVNNNIDEMYLTHLPKQTDEDNYLVKILSDYGFVNVSKLKNEDVLLKKLIPNRDVKDWTPLEIGRSFYPTFYDGVMVRKFIIPIIPKFHDRLFTDWHSRHQLTLDEKWGEFIVEGNTIKKAYLCHSNIERISKGDLLLFYRSHDLKKLTSVGTIEQVCRMNEPDKILATVKNRTVYNKEEIRGSDNKHKSTLVILFKWNFYLQNEISFHHLKELKILSFAPQTLTRIEHSQYLTIKKECGIPERYTVH